ncbi:Zinc finger, RING-type [Dillenia turbinata]|uniref:Zinc finger, RING-type n=1 Tax=Dillenia turbinata TaxID=194707 RepID=A0AAN8VY35_9MAGN
MDCEMEIQSTGTSTLEEDHVEFDDDNDGTTYDGERCGICMDVIIDRGLLDCCQHWFCFSCIDNWATITNLCPLCQNEFQLVTCIPVYDTIGSNKADDDSVSRDNDWYVEGKNNTLSFPSYYIDENAVTCLDGADCKIRNGSVRIEEDSNFDMSIACDSCDIWYHALCVGFDPDGTAESSWLCPRCVLLKTPRKPDTNANGGCMFEDAFSKKLSVSVVDAGETAVVVSRIEGNQPIEQASLKRQSNIVANKDLKVETPVSASAAYSPALEAPSGNSLQPESESLELKLCPSQDLSSSLPSDANLGELKRDCTDEETQEASGMKMLKISPAELLGIFDSNGSLCENKSSLSPQLDISVRPSQSADNSNDETIKVEQKDHLEESTLSTLEADNDQVTGLKRKHMGSSGGGVHATSINGEKRSKTKTRVFAKKTKLLPSMDLGNECCIKDSRKCLAAVSEEDEFRHSPEENNVATDIMSIVQETNYVDKSLSERENTSGVRVKKIMRRTSDNKESSLLVLELRKEIREAVRNNSPEDVGRKLFDPKLLAAFRAAVVGPKSEQVRKVSPLVAKAKRSMLQKGKVRENLTKKIYATSSGKRRRAWDRDCEIEFWKHRCIYTARPEKVETLRSVLELLKKNSNTKEEHVVAEMETSNSILSRLYLADTSVFPRKEDIKPLSALKSEGDKEDHQSGRFTESVSYCAVKTQKVVKTSPKTDAAAVKKLHSKNQEGRSLPTIAGVKVDNRKEVTGKSDDIKSDKRKWALEVLARKMAVGGKSSAPEKGGDNAILKGNFPLLAQLPADMRPVLAASRHNKIPLSVRQAQLYRLSEHFLKKANLSVIHRTAATELAVADAVNIEKEVADRSNSKIVYMNLCSQELLRHSNNSKSDRSTESITTLTSEVSAVKPEQETNELSADPEVEEALKNAGLLSDSPPGTPIDQVKAVGNIDDPSTRITDDGPDNILEMDSHPELDIYGDFEYDLEDEDYIGAAATKASMLQPAEGESKMKVVFSTLIADGRSVDSHSENDKSVNEPQDSHHALELHKDKGKESSPVQDKVDPLGFLEGHAPDGGEEPSLEDCEDLYGPDKEPLIVKYPETASRIPSLLTGLEAANSMISGSEKNKVSCQAVKSLEVGKESCAESKRNTTTGNNSSGGENSSNCLQTDELSRKKANKFKTNDRQPSDSSCCIPKKVEAYIKEHIRPLCKSGVITPEQYRWAVAKTTEKVMRFHAKDKNANFLIKEGEKVKKLAEQYVEAAQHKQK